MDPGSQKMTIGQVSPSKFESFKQSSDLTKKLSSRPNSSVSDSFWQGFCQFLPVFPVSGRVSGSKRLTLQLFPLKSQSKTSFHLSSQSGGPAPCTGQAAWGIVKIWGWKLSLRHLLASSQPPYTLETSRLNPDSLTHVSKSILETHQGS